MKSRLLRREYVPDRATLLPIWTVHAGVCLQTGLDGCMTHPGTGFELCRVNGKSAGWAGKMHSSS